MKHSTTLTLLLLVLASLIVIGCEKNEPGQGQKTTKPPVPATTSPKVPTASEKAPGEQNTAEEEHNANVIVFEEVANAPGTYLGDENARLNLIRGHVAKVLDKGPPLKLQKTQIPVELAQVFYEGNVGRGGLVKPTKGKVQRVRVGQLELVLADQDIGSGAVKTKEFGNLHLFFISSLAYEECILAFPAEAFARLQSAIKSGKTQ